MNFAEAREAFLAPPDPDAPPPALDWNTPARALRDAIEPLATICWWGEPAHAAYEALGLDFLQAYAWSRACTLGEPDASVVVATFGVFEPGAISGIYAAAREAATLQQIRTARMDGSVASLREALGDPEGLSDVLAALRRGAEAASWLGRPLLAGLGGMGWPDDELGQLFHACAMLREARGDSHLAALVGAGLGGLEANILTELWVGYAASDYSSSRAFAPEAIEAAQTSLTRRGLLDDAGAALTDAGRTLRDAIEQTTDAAMAPVLGAIGDDAEHVVRACNGWSTALIERGWFPPDPLKRAAG